MGIVKTVSEVVRERMNECTDAGAQQFIGSIKPIYGSSHNGIPIHIGTCILLQIDNNKYLLTAAHVTDENEYSSLYIGGESELILIEGNFFRTEKPEGDRKKDHYDFAWLKINDEFIKKIGDVSFVEETQLISDNGSTEGKLYLALGYPNSQNKKINTHKASLTPKYIKYSSTIKPNDALCQKLGVSGEEHLFLGYDSTYSKDNNGHKVNSFAPKGISGGALVDMGKISDPKSYIPQTPCNGKIAGMLVENHKEFKAMSAVKINVVLDQIKGKDAL